MQCKPQNVMTSSAGTPSKISTVDDLVASIVSIVEKDIEGTSAGTGRYALLSKQRLGSGCVLTFFMRFYRDTYDVLVPTYLLSNVRFLVL